MGRKVHPIGFRLGINQPWGGRWFAEGSTYRQQLHQDFAIRWFDTVFLQRQYAQHGGVSGGADGHRLPRAEVFR